jgi:dipeptidyl aminopeptidase/acylaminoacyl peptidase
MSKASMRIRYGMQAALAASLIGTTAGAFAADKHPFGIDDFGLLRSAQAVAVSPDGKAVLYDVLSRDDKGPQKHEWRLIDVDGSHGHKLELPEKFSPAGFTPEGDLFGIYKVEDIGQLAIVSLSAGKPTLIFALPRGIHGAAISPDGKQYALSTDGRPKDPLEKTHSVVENDESSVYIINRTGVDDGAWCPDLKFVVDLAWSPDSSQLAVVTMVPKLGNHQVQSSVSVCGPKGAREVTKITNATAGLAWSKDAKDIVFASTTAGTLTPEHVWSVAAAGGAAVDRTPQLEGTATTVKGGAHGEIWVEMHKGVIIEAYAFADGQLTPAFKWPDGVLAGLPVNSPFTASPPMLAFSVQDPQHTTNVAVANSGSLQKITHEGDEGLAKLAIGEIKVVHWTSKEGIKLEGIATFPVGYESGKKYPFVVLPHGGPEGNDSLSLDAFSQVIACKGYVVLQPQYRGSTGYGSAFMAAIYQHFGDRAYRDVDSATDFAIAQGWADPNRLAIFGWSAGGFMTSWTVTQTHRYKAAIEGAGITDWLSFIPTSDTWQTDYDARLQEKDPAPMLKFSAVMYADRVTTPLLILHGDADVRVPTFQGHEFYALLKERGKTVRMVTYPGSPHFPVLSEQQRDVFKETLDWLAKYNP